MSQLKKVFFKLTLVKTKANSGRMSDLLLKYRQLATEKSLKNGYKEMALINLSLAEMCFEADSEALRLSEEKLTECE